MVKDCFEKFKSHPVKRYYLLSTKQTQEQEMKKIRIYIKKVQKIHGCQIVVNGVIDSIKYYLRLIEDTENFLEAYGVNLENDEAIKAEQKELWNKIVENKNKT